MSRVDFNVGGPLKRAADLVKARSKLYLQLPKRAAANIARRIKPEAARQIAAQVLNLPASRITTAIRSSVRDSAGESFVTLSANKVRPPLSDFRGTFSNTGYTVTTWRKAGAKRFPHAFARPDARGVWQRVPGAGGKLVPRLPIAQRKGPSIHRVFITRGRFAGRSDITPSLSAFVQLQLTREIVKILQARNG